MQDEFYTSKTKEELINELVELHLRFDESEATLNAIRNGEIDAIVTPNGNGSQVYTLESADYLYRVLVQEMNEGVATLTYDGTIIYCNAQLASMLNIPLAHLTGQKLIDFIHLEDLDLYQTIFDEGLETGSTGELRVKSVNDIITPVQISINTSKDLKGVYVVITDLSEHKHHEELKVAYEELKKADRQKEILLGKIEQYSEGLEVSNKELQVTTKELQIALEELHQREDELLHVNQLLRESEEDLKRQAAMLNVSNEAIFTWNYNSGILSWNQGAERLYGYTAEEAIGRISYELLNTEFPIELKKFKEILLIEKMWTGEITHTTKDGQEIIVESRFQLIEDNLGRNIVIETNRDITKRKKVENALRKSEARFRSVLTNSIDVVYRFNLQTDHFEYMSPAVKKIYNIEPDVFMEMGNDEIYSRIHPDDRLAMRSALSDIKKNGEGLIEYRLRGQDDNYRWLSNQLVIVKDKDGKPLYRDGFVRDITKRKEIEKKLEKNIDELKRSNRELEEFAYVASHDLQEPLRMVSSFTQLLEMKYKDILDAEALEYIKYAVDGAKRMQELINDLLIYSRVTSNAKKFEDINLEKVLDEVLFNLEIVIEENEAVIIWESLPNIQADYRQMVQLFQNLIGNALKYRSMETPQVHISAVKENNYWLFSVEDNGIGMEAEYFEQVFQIFRRLHSSDEYEGTGIGLAITKRIIERHGGRIWVESEFGEGSTFYFTIPIR